MMEQSNEYAEIGFEIKPYDIDAAGHVNNAVYIHWLEDLRVNLFKKILPLETLTNRNIFLVVAFTSIKYKTPLALYDIPRGVIRINKYCKGIWYLTAKFLQGDRIIAEAFQKCVLFDRKNNRMIRKIFSTYREREYEIN